MMDIRKELEKIINKKGLSDQEVACMIGSQLMVLPGCNLFFSIILMI
jgi:hypothetical protein